jgi:hypothetical protein
MKVINGGQESLILGSCRISNYWKEAGTTRIEFIGGVAKGTATEAFIIQKSYADMLAFLSSDETVLDAKFSREV